MGGPQKGSAELKELGIVFDDYPKPVGLIEYLVRMNEGKDFVVLDFFAGSCTTAHAVMKVNAADGGSRKSIMVQLPEPCREKSKAKKAGYQTIAEIGKERIRRAARVISEELGGSLDLKDVSGLDLGITVFKLDRSNFKIWDGDVEGADDLGKQLSLHVQHIAESSSAEDILYELLLKAGFPLTTKVEKREMAAKEVFSVQDGALLICLDKEITSELIDALAEAEPLQVICLDEGFKGNDQLKANAVQTFKARAQAEESEIVFRTV